MGAAAECLIINWICQKNQMIALEFRCLLSIEAVIVTHTR